MKKTPIILFAVLVIIGNPIKGQMADKELYEGKDYNEIASYICGFQLNEESLHFRLFQDKPCLDFRKNIRYIWTQIEKTRLSKMRGWRDQRLNQDNLPKTLLYPFSGPDILNALTFFPDMDYYFMIALEPAGDIPDPFTLKKQVLHDLTSQMRKALQTLFSVNFFRTNEMKVNLKENSFSSFSSLMLFFIYNLGYEIENYRMIKLDQSGQMVYYTGNNLKLNSGVEFQIRKKGSEKIQYIRYISQDLSDMYLKRNQLFLKYMKNFPKTVTLLKAASYLMHEKSFGMIRSLILEKSELILQDDSGIPLKYFKENVWNIDYWGSYRVLQMFKMFRQLDLEEKIKTKSKGILPFAYGYGYKPQNSNLMVIRKKGK